jgi:hypothetical protein
VVAKLEEVTASAGLVKEVLLDLNYLWLDRDADPRNSAYSLRYDVGPGSGPDVWQVSSIWRGVGHFTLERVPAAGN